jgi:VWFA-related protein
MGGGEWGVVKPEAARRTPLQSWQAQLAILFLLATPLAFGQAAQSAARPNPDQIQDAYRLRVESDLVVVRVVVRDAQGHVLPNLQKEDFRVFEDGKEQTIAQFAVENSTQQTTNASGPTSTPNSKAPVRYLALYFDDLDMPFDEITHAREAVDKYLTEAVTATTRVGIFTSSGSVRVEFTSDLAKLHAGLLKLQSKSRVGNGCPHISDYQAKMIVEWTPPPVEQDAAPNAAPSLGSDAMAVALDEAKNLCYMTGVNGRLIWMLAHRVLDQATWQAQYSLQGLSDVVNHAADMPGQRNVVFISPGFLTEELQSDLDAIIDRALRSEVVIGSIDSTGLAVGLTQSNARMQYDPLDPHLSSARRELQVEREQAALSVLDESASGTGGAFFHNDNDLNAGLRSATAISEISYILAFAPKKLKADGRFHRLKVTLREKHKGIAVLARRGFFAPQAGAKPEDALAESLRAAVLSTDELQDLPLDITTETSRSPESSMTQLAVMARMEVGTLHFKKDGDHNLNTLTFVSCVFDKDGLWVGGQQKKLPLDLGDDKLQQLRASPGVLMRSAFQLAPGTYSVREVVMDSEDHHLGALTRTLVVPDLQPKNAKSTQSGH